MRSINAMVAVAVAINFRMRPQVISGIVRHFLKHGERQEKKRGQEENKDNIHLLSKIAPF